MRPRESVLLLGGTTHGSATGASLSEPSLGRIATKPDEPWSAYRKLIRLTNSCLFLKFLAAFLRPSGYRESTALVEGHFPRQVTLGSPAVRGRSRAWSRVRDLRAPATKTHLPTPRTSLHRQRMLFATIALASAYGYLASSPSSSTWKSLSRMKWTSTTDAQ